jgi:hypothetical protein
MNRVRQLWEEQPLKIIIFAGVFFRILAAIFSKGFGMHDDHFLIIEAAQSWADGSDYNYWLPSSGATQPSGHSFFYTGLHYFLFKFLNWINFTDPDAKMYLIRFMHAAFSILTIVLGFKITEHYSNKKTARVAGLMLAIYWFMPMLSVRNLVEVVCAPFLLYATWLIIKAESKNKSALFFYAGLIAGLAFSIRFQSLFFVAGFGLYLLISKQFKAAVLFGLGALLTMCSIQGLIDYNIWGRPFAEFMEYVNYNMTHPYSYSTLPWYNYFITLAGILIPPVSLFLLFGFFKSWKKNLLLFLPSFIFLAFHCYFPNKQERFIFPIVPFVIMLGIIGWTQFAETSGFWQKRQKLLRNCWIFFWVLNTLPLLFISVSYSKRNRVEAMLYLQKKGDVKNLIIEDSNRDDWMMPPLFYLKKWISPYGVTTILPYDTLRLRLQGMPLADRPNYVIFMQAENMDKRVVDFQKNYATLKYEATIEPGQMDRLLHWLNPNNENNTSTIYKIEEVLPDKK